MPLFLFHVSKREQCLYAVLCCRSHCSCSLQHLHELRPAEESRQNSCLSTDSHMLQSLLFPHILSMYKERIYLAKKKKDAFFCRLFLCFILMVMWNCHEVYTKQLFWRYPVCSQHSKKPKALLWKLQQRQQRKIFKTCISARCWVQVVKFSSQTDGDSELEIQLWKSCDFQWESCA